MKVRAWDNSDTGGVDAFEAWEVDLDCEDFMGPIDRIEVSEGSEYLLLVIRVCGKEHLLCGSDLAKALEGGKIDGTVVV